MDSEAGLLKALRVNRLNEIATIERADGISPATVGLTIAEGKGILESLQKEIVTAQVQHLRRTHRSPCGAAAERSHCTA